MLGDQPGGGLGGCVSRCRTQLLYRGALCGRDLVLGHARATPDQRFGVGPGLGDDFVRLVPRAREQGRAVLVGGRRLRLIFGLKRLGFLAQRLGLGELVADEGDFAVERAPDRARHFLPDEQREDDEDR